MKNVQILSIIFCTLLIFSSCDDCEVDEMNTAGITTEFQTLYQSLLASGHEDRVYLDTEIHAYTFSLNQDEEVCKIGYQSQSGIADRQYQIEIEEESSGTLLYSDAHVFSSDNTSYVEPSSTISLRAGTSYIIRRIQTDWSPSIGNTIGRVALKDSMDFPYTQGILSITGADFYQNGGPIANVAVPFIDLVFKNK